MICGFTGLTQYLEELRALIRLLADNLKQLEREMRFHAGELNFELAAEIRDKIRELKKT